MTITFGVAFFGQTHSDFNKNYPFGRLHSWNFANSKVNTRDSFGYNEIWDVSLRDNLEIQLRTLGFTRVMEDPDFNVDYRLGTKERHRIRVFHDDYWAGGVWPGFWPGYPYYWRGWMYWRGGWGGGTSTVYRTPYDESTLVVDILDGKTGDLVWRGYDRREMGSKSEKTLRKSVEKVIGRFGKDIHRNREKAR
jgi:hypothetical protein